MKGALSSASEYKERCCCGWGHLFVGIASVEERRAVLHGC